MRDKCIGLLTGNHEGANLKYNGQDIQANILEWLNVDNKTLIPDLGYCAYIRLTFEKVDEQNKHIRSRNVIIYATHGSRSGGRKTGSKLNATEQLHDAYTSDIAMKFHVHSPGHTVSEIKEMTGSGKPQLVRKKRIAIIPSNFHMDTDEQTVSYGEEAEYGGTRTAVIPIEIRPNSGEMRVID